MALQIVFLLLLITAGFADAQPSPPKSNGDDGFDPYRQNFNAATAILIVVIVSGFFFLAFFSLYFRRCPTGSGGRSSLVVPATAAAAASRRGARRGLDPAVIETFPVMSYSEAAGLRVEKGATPLECAVCLSEFAGDEALRMLPKCCHVFHPECIDTWLESHVTCPVCRANLSVVPAAEDGGEGQVSPEIPAAESGHDNHETTEGEVAIDMTRVVGPQSDEDPRIRVDDGERFRLRLPEHVRREIVAAGKLRRSASVAAFRSGEGSSRRGYRGRNVWAGLSDRWAAGALTRALTWRRGDMTDQGSSSSVKPTGETSRAGEGSSRGRSTLNCLSVRGRGEPGYRSDDSESSTAPVLTRV